MGQGRETNGVNSCQPRRGGRSLRPLSSPRDLKLSSFVRSLARYEMKFDEFQKKKKEKESRRIIDIKKISSHIV